MPRQSLSCSDWNSYEDILKYYTETNSVKKLFSHIDEEISYDPSNKDLVWMKYIPIWSTYINTHQKKEMEFIIQTFIDNLGVTQTLKTTVISEDMPLDDKICMSSYMIKKELIKKEDLANTIIEVFEEYQTICGELTLENLSLLPQQTLEWLMDLDVLFQLCD
jgi:hypothetical protein